MVFAQILIWYLDIIGILKMIEKLKIIYKLHIINSQLGHIFIVFWNTYDTQLAQFHFDCFQYLSLLLVFITIYLASLFHFPSFLLPFYSFLFIFPLFLSHILTFYFDFKHVKCEQMHENHENRQLPDRSPKIPRWRFKIESPVFSRYFSQNGFKVQDSCIYPIERCNEKCLQPRLQMALKWP